MVLEFTEKGRETDRQTHGDSEKRALGEWEERRGEEREREREREREHEQE